VEGRLHAGRRGDREEAESLMDAAVFLRKRKWIIALERFFASSDFDECLLWAGAINKDGYGVVVIDNREVLLHRVSYEAIISCIVHGYEIDHLCRIRRCFNPFHLEQVPHRVNVLRGNGLAAVNARKTACDNGHALIGTNLTHGRSRGKIFRRCVICNRESSRRWARISRSQNLRPAAQRLGSP